MLSEDFFIRNKPELLILLIHLVLFIICIAFTLLGKLNLKREHFALLFIIPIVGPVMAIVVEWMNITGKQGSRDLDMLPLSLDDILWKSLKSYNEDGNIVPLEEAMLVNDYSTRRRIMLDALYDDPMKYLEVLMIARNNDDIDTTHYATTMIAHAQKSFQLSLQECAIGVEKNPGNIDLLDEYINTMEKYIESDLLEEYLLRNQRITYLKLLDKKLSILPNDQTTLIKKLKNCIELGDYFSAFEVSQLLKQYWHSDETTWIETIRVCVEGKDQKKLQETIDELKGTKIEWTRQGRDAVSHWLGEALA